MHWLIASISGGSKNVSCPRYDLDISQRRLSRVILMTFAHLPSRGSCRVVGAYGVPLGARNRGGEIVSKARLIMSTPTPYIKNDSSEA